MAKNSIDVVLKLRGAAAFNKQATSAARSTDKIGQAGKRASKNMDLTSRAAKAGHSQLRRVAGAAAGAAAAYTSISGAKQAISTTSELAKATLGLHNNLGLSLDSASQWAGVAKARGIDAKAMNMSFGTLSKNITAAQDPTSKQAEEFKRLGLSQQEIVKGGKDFNSLLMNTADGFQKMGKGPQRTATSMKLFGRGWQTIVPLMRDGSAGLEESLSLVDKYGASLKGMSKKEMKDLIQAERESKLATQGLQIAFGRFLAPGFTKALNWTNKFVREMRAGKGAGGDFKDAITGIWQAIKPTAVWLGRAAVSIGKFFGRHPGLAQLVGGLVLVGLAIRKIPGGKWLAKHVLSGLGNLGKRLLDRLAPPMVSAGRTAGRRAGTTAGKNMATQTTAQAGTGVIGQSGKGGKLGRAFGAAGAMLGPIMAAAVIGPLFSDFSRRFAAKWDRFVAGLPGGGGGKGIAGKGKYLIPGVGAAAGGRALWEKAFGGNALGGTIPRGGASWVGERGPEMAIAGASGTRIIPASGSRIPQIKSAVTARGAGGGGEVGLVHSHVYIDGRQVAESVDRVNKSRAARR